MPSKHTGKKAASDSSNVLKDGRTANDSESAAGSALSQADKLSFASSDIPQLWTIASKLGDWLNTLLQLYFVINIAIVGWILTTRPHLDLVPKLILAAIYLLIIFVNLGWMVYLNVMVKKNKRQNSPCSLDF